MTEKPKDQVISLKLIVSENTFGAQSGKFVPANSVTINSSNVVWTAKVSEGKQNG